jgi:general secretion pathway protein G
MRIQSFLVVALVALAACSYKPGPEVLETKRTLVTLGTAIEKYKKDLNKYPTALSELVDPPKAKEEAKKWKGPYIKDIPRDGWGNNFIYNPTGKNGAPYDLISYGADSREGGAKDDQDLARDPRSVLAPKK